MKSETSDETIPPGTDTVVVRHGEVGVKSSAVQISMEKKLRRNIENLLRHRGIEGEVERRWSRILVRVPEEDAERATQAATDAFGVVSASPAISVPAELDAILDSLEEIAPEFYNDGSFAVRARRAGEKDEHGFTSKQIEEKGGSAIWEAVEDDFEPEVDLDSPDVTFHIECRREEAFIFLEKHGGPGGLPLGTQEKVVALVSGGFDSPVAAWNVMKRGCEIVPVYFDLGDYGGADHEARALETVRRLAEYAPERDMDVRKVSAGEFVDSLVENVESTRMLSLRRFMLQAAEHVAREEGARGIVTGESIGQKSSQTSANLDVTTRATDLPVHRPLIGMDKQEIIRKSKQIGTYDGATIPAGCNRIAPQTPATHATVEQVVENEPDDIFEKAREAAENVEVVNVNVRVDNRSNSDKPQVS